MKSVNLETVRFKFSNGMSVIWNSEGRGMVNGKEYAQVWTVVLISEDTISLTKRTSLQANKSNSLDFVKDYVNRLPVS